MIGIINLNKPSGMSSSNAVVKIKKLTHQSRVGHMGTLDPLASGVLIIGVGKATRLFDYYLKKSKTYIAKFKFGVLTDTLDSEGVITNTSDKIPTADEIIKVLPTLTGKISQYPPAFSAKCINGTRAYKLARQGVEVNLEPKVVEISCIELLEKVSPDEYTFRIDCSAGTYIRSIARDMGEALGTYGIMTALTRTKCGVFTLSESVNLDDLTEDNIESFLTPLDKALENLAEYNVDSATKLKKVLNGVPIDVGGDNRQIVVKSQGEVLGIAEINDGKLKIINYLKE